MDKKITLDVKTLLIIGLGVLVLVFAILFFTKPNDSSNSTSTSAVEQSSSSNSTTTKSKAKTKVKNGKNILYEGTYVMGEDLDPGSYDFIYTTDAEKDAYYHDSIVFEGSEEDPAYDVHYSGNYEEAINGKVIHLNLKKGEKIEVRSSYGTWTY